MAAAFLSFCDDPDASYRVAFSIKLDAGGVAGDLDAAMAVADGDWSMDLTAVDGVRTTISLRYIDGTAYARTGGSWREVPGYPDEGSEPLGSVAAARDVEYLGPARVGAFTFHHLRIGDATAFDPRTVVSSLGELAIDEQAFDVYLDDDGLPVQATFTLTGTATSGGRSEPVRIVARYGFSDIGEPIVIEAPRS